MANVTLLSKVDGTPDPVVPNGGTTGQVLAKASNTDLDLTWANAGAGGPASQLDANGTTLDVDAIADGEYLRRVGTSVVGATPSGGSPTGPTVEVDLGAAKFTGKFTITDASITATSKVLCWQAPGPYTGKGTRADEAAMQPVSVISVEPATGTAVVQWQTPPGFTQQVLLPSGRRFAGIALNEQMLFPTLVPRRVGLVRGNVKFTYIILA